MAAQGCSLAASTNSTGSDTDHVVTTSRGNRWRHARASARYKLPAAFATAGRSGANAHSPMSDKTPLERHAAQNKAACCASGPDDLRAAASSAATTYNSAASAKASNIAAWSGGGAYGSPSGRAAETKPCAFDARIARPAGLRNNATRQRRPAPQLPAVSISLARFSGVYLRATRLH